MTAAMAQRSEFRGRAARLTAEDVAVAARLLYCDVPCVRAVAEVEGGRSGFLRDGRPIILFESYQFHRRTGGAYDGHPGGISTPRWERNYRGGAREYDRLAKAMALDRTAALASTSWGMFQILGSNHGVCGFPDVEAFVRAHLVSEGEHLRAFVGFVLSNKLDDELRDRRWAAFARAYNGPAYRQNRYDERLAAAYARYADGWLTPSTADVQRALNRHGAALVVDGRTGPRTRDAVRDFQRRHGLAVDGLVGPKTLAALGLGETHDPLEVSRLLNG